MAQKKPKLIAAITDNLAFMSESTLLQGTLGLYDEARAAQEFFKGIFNLAFDYKLEELDTLHGVTNFPAIDLGDPGGKLSIQITIDNSSTKIKDAVTVFAASKKELYKTYDRLIIFIIGKKKTYKAKFDTQGKFTFDPGKDIWDSEHLIKEINKIDDIAKLEAIDRFLQDQLSTYAAPDHLFPQDISECIVALKKAVPDLLAEKADDVLLRAIPQRDDDFLIRKNKFNNISWDFFIKHVRGHLPYGDIIQDFLKDPINISQQRDYFAICDAIQKFYSDHKDSYATFEDVFKEIFCQIPRNYDSDISGVKVKIVLHNMYFNCDIGDNPDDAQA